jgi:OmpA-OmpF porin, OOP family
MTRSRSIPVVMALAALAAPAVAQAQSQTESFALNRFNPSERGSDWFANESLDLRGHLRPFVGVVGDWSYKPLVLYNRDGDEVSSIVRHQIFAHVGGGVILWERLRLAASMPLLVYNKGHARTTANGTFASSNGTTIGDLRLGVDLRLLGEYGGPFTMAVGGQAFLPTGNEDAFATDGQVRLQPRLLGAGDLGPFTYAAQAGFAYRPHKGRLDSTRFGNEMTFTAGAGLRLIDKKLLVGPELYGSTVARKGSVFHKRTTPVELIFGGKYQVGSGVRVGAGIGPGLTRGLGAPKVRVLAALEWLPDIVKEKPVPPSDRDQDGIIDSKDACPDVAGEPNEDPNKNGCPPPTDRDGDGIFDDDDACPDEAGKPNEDPKKNGCPPSDRDKDKILDDDDACPDEPGEPNDDPNKNGCPPPKDRDGDGILDEADACPDEPGVPNDDPKKNGCPLAKVEQGQIVILERVEFETNSDKLMAASDPVLNAVLKVMQDHPEITKVSVEGHTDNRGGVAHNLGLSKRRAASVLKWLVSHGIDVGRLQSQGFGLKRPIDTNDTDEGRQNNRRVEFHIIEKDGKPVPQGDAK